VRLDIEAGIVGEVGCVEIERHRKELAPEHRHAGHAHVEVREDVAIAHRLLERALVVDHQHREMRLQ